MLSMQERQQLDEIQARRRAMENKIAFIEVRPDLDWLIAKVKELSEPPATLPPEPAAAHG